MILNEDFVWENYTETDVKNVYINIENKIKKYLENVKKIDLSKNSKDLTFKKIYKDLDLLNGFLAREIGVLRIFELSHGDKKIREISRTEVLRIVNLFNILSYDEDLYKVLKAYFDNFYKKEKNTLTKEEIKIVDETMRSYKNKGMHLPKEKRDLLIKLNSKIDKIASDFNLACTKNYEKGVWFSREELSGVPESIISGLKFEKNKYFVSAFLSSQYLVVKKYATNKNTRIRITKINEAGVGLVNTKRLGEILKLRSQISKILGFKTFSDLSMNEQMVSDPKLAKKFLEDLAKNLSKKLKTEKEDAKKILARFGENLNSSNVLFAENILQNEKVKLNLEELSEYFEYENTLKAMFSIWEKYFGVVAKFERNLKVFGNDVEIYSFKDKKTGENLGTAIFDLFPREGKYGHACVESINQRYFDIENKLHSTTAILICNFNKNKNGKTLLDMQSVSTLFHEGGHLLHVLLGKNNYSTAGSFNTSVDFIEIHSQFLENFPTTKIAVNEIAKHYQNNSLLPVNLLEKIKYADHYFGSFLWIRQSVQSLFDLEIHGKNIFKYANNPILMDDLFEKLFKKYIGIPSITKQQFVSNFAHITGGYESKYYSYSVSRVYAQDCWDEFVKKGLTSNNIKIKEYKKMLEFGGTIPEKENLKKYLGRNPKQKAFLDLINN